MLHNHGHAGILEYGATGPNNTYLNNLFLGNDQGDYALLTGHAPVGTLDVDPKLVDYKGDGTGDYHLLPGSPCIDHGTSADAPADDLDHNPRPYGAGWDIGPYEWVMPPDGGPASGSVTASSGAGGAGGAGGSGAGQTSGGTGGSDVGSTGGSAAGNGSGATGGCGCRQAGSSPSPSSFWLLALLGVLARTATRTRSGERSPRDRAVLTGR